MSLRVCACPRREPMDSMPRSVIYRHGDRCRKRAYRAKVKAKAKAAGLEVAPSLRAIDALSTTTGRDGHAETGRKRAQGRRPELRASYRKVVEAFNSRFDQERDEPWHVFHRDEIEEIVAEALTPRQRAYLEQETRS